MRRQSLKSCEHGKEVILYHLTSIAKGLSGFREEGCGFPVEQSMAGSLLPVPSAVGPAFSFELDLEDREVENYEAIHLTVGLDDSCGSLLTQKIL
ncbi:hypothetical protein HGM15179_018445 [Zosterops borbonicus]|uniref:Uncharacterized protein n=1 Tax=Zosterops borbonicus TaxID=364589 RepID=A0A8K1LC51_9PASS|nr:hypothetical protein HGM15179_018445 [Zosterops borbonicus]